MADTGIEKYVRAAQIDVPKDLFEAELDLLLLEDAHRAQYNSFFTGEFKILSPEEKKEAYEELKKIAYWNVKTELAIKQVIETEDFKVTPEDLAEAALGISQRQGVTLEQIRDFFGEELSALRRDILVKKAEDFMRSHWE